MVTRGYMTSLPPSLTYKLHKNFVNKKYLISNYFAAIELKTFLYKLRILLILVLLIYIYIYTYIYIQGVPGGMCNTSGGCSLGQTVPI